MRSPGGLSRNILPTSSLLVSMLSGVMNCPFTAPIRLSTGAAAARESADDPAHAGRYYRHHPPHVAVLRQ
jgi:hypothetical protein